MADLSSSEFVIRPTCQGQVDECSWVDVAPSCFVLPTRRSAAYRGTLGLKRAVEDLRRVEAPSRCSLNSILAARFLHSWTVEK
jgi:hypothetical protein